MPVINGSIFDIMAFFSDLTDKEQQDWLQSKADYDVYIKNNIPFFLLDLGSSWSLDVYLNILQENEDVQESFLGSDQYHPKINLILISYPDGVVQGVRSVDIDLDTMLRIKEACLDQLVQYTSKEACRKEALKILARYNGNQLRAKAQKAKQNQ